MPPGGLLRRHVGDRAHDRTSCSQGLFDGCRLLVVTDEREPFGQTEVDDLRDSIDGQHDVSGLEVAVQHSSGMRGRETRGDLTRDPHRLG